MKKILMIISGFRHGGTNRSLVNFLGMMKRQDCTFEILPLYREGPYKKVFRSYAVISETELLFPSHRHSDGKKKKEHSAVFRLFYKLYMKAAINLFGTAFAKAVGKRLQQNGYDTVIAFEEGFPTKLASCIAAGKHIAWVRCDYSRYVQLHNGIDESRMYQNMDSIVAVSQYTADVLKRMLPTVADRVVAIHNIIDDRAILEKSKQPITNENFSCDTFTVLSIGRMDPVKRFSAIPAMAAALKKKNLQFTWYIIGDGGNEKEKIKSLIEELRVGDCVRMLGAIDNPYPYIKACSVLACISSSEACPNVVNEARILHVPVVAADFPTAKEWIENGKNGFIAPLDRIPDILADLIQQDTLYGQLQENIADFAYDNSRISEKLEALLDIKKEK